MISVLVVDDHAIVRQGYVKLISSFPEMTVCNEADSGEDGYAAFLKSKPDVVITDLSMKGISGLILLQKILVRDKNAKVIICSMYDNPSLVSNAISSGARGFVSKSADPLQIIQAIKGVSEGNIFLSNDLVGNDSDQNQLDDSEKIRQLTSKEFEIFKMLAEGKSISMCAQVLHISEKTVNNYQTSIREKLMAKNTAELVHLALRNGIIKSFN
jgi:DNA-binding NarL/FixJ family response regulator